MPFAFVFCRGGFTPARRGGPPAFAFDFGFLFTQLLPTIHCLLTVPWYDSGTGFLPVLFSAPRSGDFFAFLLLPFCQGGSAQKNAALISNRGEKQCRNRPKINKFHRHPPLQNPIHRNPTDNQTLSRSSPKKSPPRKPFSIIRKRRKPLRAANLSASRPIQMSLRDIKKLRRVPLPLSRRPAVAGRRPLIKRRFARRRRRAASQAPRGEMIPSP